MTKGSKMKKIAGFCLFLAICFSSLYSVNDESPVTRERIREAVEQYDINDEMDPYDANYYYELWNILFALVVIITVMFVGAWLLRRFMQGKMEQMNVSSTIKILEQRNLSPKSVLYIVEVYNKHILIGESAAGVAPISEFPIEEDSTFQELMEKK
jgi:flagellar biogenesis protein FliO